MAAENQTGREGALGGCLPALKVPLTRPGKMETSVNISERRRDLGSVRGRFRERLVWVKPVGMGLGGGVRSRGVLGGAICERRDAKIVALWRYERVDRIDVH